MKKIYIKIYIVILAAVSAYMSHAAYLNWQVDTNSDGLAYNSQTGECTFNGQIVTGAKVVARGSEGSYDLQTYDNVIGNVLGNPVVGIVDAVGSGELYADLSSYHKEGYSYYIELMSDTTTVAVSQGLTYADSLAKVSQTLGGDAVSGGSQLALWSGGSAYAVPEPTGALLVMIGAAMLGLKRRKV